MSLRWLLTVALALGLSLAALERETYTAGERRAEGAPGRPAAAFLELPVGAETDVNEARVLTRLTH